MILVAKTVRDDLPATEQVFESFPIKIGRSANNDLRIMDASVSAEHALIEFHGGKDSAAPRFKIRDLSSRNKIRHEGEILSEKEFDSSVSFFLGRTMVQLTPMKDEVTEEINLSRFISGERRRTHSHHFAFLFVGVFAWMLFIVSGIEVWSPYNDERVSILLWNLFGASVAIPVLSFFLFLALKGIGRKIRFADPLEKVAVLFWAFPLVSIFSWTVYYFATPTVSKFLVTLFSAGLFAYALVQIVSIRKRESHFMFRAGWALIALFLYFSPVVINRLVPSDSDAPKPLTEIYPPVLGYAGITTTPETLLKDIRKLSAEKTKKAQEMLETR